MPSELGERKMPAFDLRGNSPDGVEDYQTITALMAPSYPAKKFATKTHMATHHP